MSELDAGVWEILHTPLARAQLNRRRALSPGVADRKSWRATASAPMRTLVRSPGGGGGAEPSLLKATF
jgi:hypothetical protein